MQASKRVKSILFVILFVLIVIFIMLANTWAFMMALGTMHHNISEAIPPAGFFACFWPAVFITALTKTYVPRKNNESKLY
jgi:hypothetical protein